MLIITNRFHPQIGGAELNIYYQAQELSKHMNVDVLTPVRDTDPLTEMLDNVSVHRCYNIYNPLNKFPYRDAMTFCPSVVSQALLRKYDVIHCFPAINRNNVLALFASRILGRPIFLSNFDAFDYARLLSSGVTVSEFDRLELSSRAKRLLSKFNAIFTISQKETNLLREANPNTFLSTVPIKLEEYSANLDENAFRKEFGIPLRHKVVLCLSRISYIKGQDILLRAIPDLKNRVEDFVVVIAGRNDYEPDFFSSLCSYVDEYDLRDRVIFTGPLTRSQVLAALKSCSVHVLPMRFMNSGAINTETWASGRPILQSCRVDPNYVKQGVNGFTFDVESKSDLVEKLVWVLDNPGRASAMGENGRKFVLEKFLYQHLIKQYLDAYAEFGGVEL